MHGTEQIEDRSDNWLSHFEQVFVVTGEYILIPGDEDPSYGFFFKIGEQKFVKICQYSFKNLSPNTVYFL